jgi:hypothetical protein
MTALVTALVTALAVTSADTSVGWCQTTVIDGSRVYGQERRIVFLGWRTFYQLCQVTKSRCIRGCGSVVLIPHASNEPYFLAH